MTTSRKIILIGLGIVILLFVALVIYPLVLEIQKESGNFVSQREELAKLEKKNQNLNNFRTSSQIYQDNFEKIEGLFINSSEPVNFIDFLEKEARNAGLGIEILPFTPQKKEGEPWSSMNFRLTLTGDFSNFLKFMERLESAPYLVDIFSLNATQAGEDNPGEDITLLIKVYSK